MRSESVDAAGLTSGERRKLQVLLDVERSATMAALEAAEATARSSERATEPMDLAELSREQGDGAIFVGRLRARLRDVEDALAKLRSGGYGVSELSGRPIGYRRLEAIPWARLVADELPQDELPAPTL